MTPETPSADTETFHVYEPALGHGLAHDPFNAIIGPRPIGWISTCDAQGRPNLAPYSFFNAFNYTPPIIGFSSISGRDTIANCAATGEFVWNLTTEALVRAMNATSFAALPGESEFGLAGLQTLPSRLVRPLRVAASPVHFECRVTDIVQLHDSAGRDVPARMTFGEVVAVHIRRDLIHDGVYRTAEARPVLRAGGRGDYAQITPDAMFELLRPATREDIAPALRPDAP
ncbi:hypothetical protein AA103196_2820 [Ameyamaea chiangmaiensis NBRC 103196]|uniref:Flavin reductase family protein n=2 Tax=Ameyamaea chiangmaiensis TaxID=442969 RepID=A0A850PB53_9PROT|nr:flavin reductase family protein [Ameyamaea chiangmaiensis]NVN41178.1 flavin reductase family protein [Ameyamaea chiangmaiensis]GBQ71601.1 hypothetical protein AA103196_2820 [Ameyamaea chiangmaiensis NBRC 103196]